MWLSAILALVLVLAGIGMIILTVVSIATFEGIASMVFLGANIYIFVVRPIRRKVKADLNGSLGAALIIMAFLGALTDQAGNPVFNKPVEWCMCESGQQLARGINVSNTNHGTRYTQDFRCFEKNDPQGTPVSMLAVIGIRFVEYLVLILFLVFLQRQIRVRKWRRKTV